MNYPLLARASRGIPALYGAMTYDEIIQLIRSAAAAQGKKQAELARVAGMPSQSAMSNVFTGKRKLTVKEVNSLKDFLGIVDEPQVQWVPIIGLASAGAWQEAVLTPVRHFPVPHGVGGGRSFGVEIKGDSMNLLLPEGGWAVVDPDERDLYNGRVYLIQNGDHEATVKRYRSDPARFEPVSDNATHKAFTVVNTHYHVIGRVVSYGNTAGL